jgi:hypothetical protein
VASYTLTTISRKEKFSRSESSVTRVMDCVPYSARFAAYDDLIGGVTLVGGRLVRRFPARDPDAPWLWVDSVEMEVWDEDPGSMSTAALPLTSAEQYVAARMTVTYKHLDVQSTQPTQNEQQEIDLATESWNDRSRNLQLPNVWYSWEGDVAGQNDGLLANQNQQAFVYQPEAELILVRHLVPTIPLNAFLTQQGRINKNTYTWKTFTFPPETLRFEKWRATRKFTTRGIKFYELGLTFGVRSIYSAIDKNNTQGWVGWNRVFDPRKGFYRRIKSVNPAAGGMTRYLHEYDTDGPTQNLGGGTPKAGFALLFHPAAT